MRQTGPQTGFSGTHAQTDGDGSNFEPLVQSTVSTQVQRPPQSAPPFVGSQLSFGSSTHLPMPGQGFPAMPPQVRPGGGVPSGTQAATGAQGPLVHSGFWASQCVPAAQRIVAQGS